MKTTSRICKLCGGTGERDDFDPCWACFGTGRAAKVCGDCGEALPGCRCVREYSARMAQELGVEVEGEHGRFGC